jgi:hypothetical protein
MHAAAKPLADGTPAPQLTQDFTAVQQMLMELESRYRSGTGKATAGDLTAEVDSRSRQFVKDLEENLKYRVQGPLASIGVLTRATGRHLPEVQLFLARMRYLWEESVRASSRLEALEQAKQSLRDCSGQGQVASPSESSSIPTPTTRVKPPASRH